MQILYCKIETELGNLYISLLPRYQRDPYCEIVFVPATPLLPIMKMEYKNHNIFFFSGWEKSCVEFHERCELIRIVEEALKWIEIWNLTESDLYWQIVPF